MLDRGQALDWLINYGWSERLSVPYVYVVMSCIGPHGTFESMNVYPHAAAALDAVYEDQDVPIGIGWSRFGCDLISEMFRRGGEDPITYRILVEPIRSLKARVPL